MTHLAQLQRRAWLPCVGALLSFAMYACNLRVFSAAAFGVIAMNRSLDPSTGPIDRNREHQVYITRVVAFICTGFLITPGVVLVAGRRGAVLFGSVLVLLAGVVQIAAIQYVAAAFAATAIVSIGHGIALPSALLYAAELAPAASRGRILAFGNVALYTGFLVSYWAVFGLGWVDWVDRMWSAYRAIVSIMFLFALIVPVSMLFAPNTPPLGHDGYEAPRPLAVVRAAGFPAKRVAIAVALNVFASINGHNEISWWSSRIYIYGFGRSRTVEPQFGFSLDGWIINSVQTVIGLLGAVVGLLLIDKLGRRKLLIIGSALLALWMVTIGGLGAGMGSNLVLDGISGERPGNLRSLAIGWAVVDSVADLASAATWEAVTLVYTAEMFAPAVGTWAVPMSFMTHFVATAIFSDLAFEKFGEKSGTHMFFFFFALNILFGLFVFFFLPETKGVPLENMEQLFAGPARQAHRLDLQQVDSDDKRREPAA
ncbi:hypothetical protein Q8F55_001796 [Vanrija albida]|uniref:Major facilitator superfamily (MFS) profile domain-containing protein n=1 Tax=Vanrija albida TaxID=181172 RepID=A0ABR3Q922_9TREE